MRKSLVIGAGILGIALGLSGCSRVAEMMQGAEAGQTGLSNSEIKQVLSLMVIQENALRSDYQKVCTHTSQCTSPLICADRKCDIPPGLTGKTQSDTPKLSFTTETGEHSVYLEIVNDEYTMARGLMMRRVCHENWGMLFSYRDEGRRSFWMSNTYIPLDIVFIRANGTVSNVAANAEPLNEGPRYQSTDRVKYVLELPAGTAEKLRIVSGSKFDMSTIP